MIDFTLADMMDDGPMAEASEVVPVFYVRTQHERDKVLEKIAAPDIQTAQEEARRLLGPVDGIFVTGPHEHVAATSDAPSSSE